jgi:hypothetical protein
MSSSSWLIVYLWSSSSQCIFVCIFQSQQKAFSPATTLLLTGTGSCPSIFERKPNAPRAMLSSIFEPPATQASSAWLAGMTNTCCLLLITRRFYSQRIIQEFPIQRFSSQQYQNTSSHVRHRFRNHIRPTWSNCSLLLLFLIISFPIQHALLNPNR